MGFKKAKHQNKKPGESSLMKKGGFAKSAKRPKQKKSLVPPTHKQKKTMQEVAKPSQFMTQTGTRAPQRLTQMPPSFNQFNTMNDDSIMARLRRATSK